MPDKKLCDRWPKDIVFKDKWTPTIDLIPEAFERGFEAALFKTIAARAESQLERWVEYAHEVDNKYSRNNSMELKPGPILIQGVPLPTGRIFKTWLIMYELVYKPRYDFQMKQHFEYLNENYPDSIIHVPEPKNLMYGIMIPHLEIDSKDIYLAELPLKMKEDFNYE